MKPTTKCLAAHKLGSELQMLKWKAFRENYNERRSQMEQALKELELPLELPLSLEEFLRDSAGIVEKIGLHLEAERKRLGGDCYALTMYFFGYVPLELVLSAAWKSQNYEDLLWLFKGILGDFGIEGEYESLKHVLDVETAWLAQQSEAHDGNVRAQDALKAALRLVSRVGTLWRAADKLDSPVKFTQLPYYSVFVSYSTVDDEFGQKLYGALTDAGLRAWFAPHDIRPGKKIHQQVYSAIEQHDKLLLVLSEASIKSEWVGTELYKARQREHEKGVQMLFPVRLVSMEAIKRWNAFDADTGRDLAREVREYFIPDFSQWRDESAFEREVHRLIDALQVETAPDPGPQTTANT